jgi:CheY-like chemotaxis protein
MNISSASTIGVYRILIVDDLPDNCVLLQTVLEIEGYQVEVADSGQAALKKIASDPPDLVLLDVMMPGMNGFEVTRYIRQNPALSMIPVLLVTGYDESTPSDGFKVGANGFIRKPIDLDCLVSQVRKFLPART